MIPAPYPLCQAQLGLYESVGFDGDARSWWAMCGECAVPMEGASVKALELAKKPER